MLLDQGSALILDGIFAGQILHSWLMEVFLCYGTAQGSIL